MVDWINEKVKVIMVKITEKLPRLEGNGWNVVKFHGLLHLASDVRSFGSPMQFHASRPEHNHKHFCKQPGRRVQMTHKD